MHTLVVALLVAAPLVTAPPAPAADPRGRASPDEQGERALARRRNDRCLGAGAGGGIGALLGMAVGGGLALGAAEVVKASDPNNSTIGKRFTDVALPVMVIVGGAAGLAAGTFSGWELSEDLVGKPAVTR